MNNDSAVPPVSVYSDGHYATLVKTRRVSVEKYKFVRGFVCGQEGRGFQHFCVRFHGDGTPMSIINCFGMIAEPRNSSFCLPLQVEG